MYKPSSDSDAPAPVVQENQANTSLINHGRIWGFSRNIFFLGVVSFLTDMSSEMIYPLLPIFLTGVLGASKSFVGLVEGIAESTASILKLFSGVISDRLKVRKPIVLFGYGLSSIVRPLMAIAMAPWHILATRFVDRVGKGIRTSPRDALIADSVAYNERGKSFGFHRGMDHAGAIVGPLLAVGILYFLPGNYRIVFALAFIPAILSVLVLLTAVHEKKPIGASSVPFKFSLKPFDRRFKVFLLIIFLFTLSNSSDAFIILRAQELGVTITFIPILWVWLHLVKMLSSMPGGMLSDRFGRPRIIALGWVIYFSTYIGLAFASQQWHIWCLLGVYGIFFGLTEGAEKALVADITDSRIRGSAYGIYNFVVGVGALPSSLIFGLIWQSFGPAVAFTYGAVLALISAVLILWVFPPGGKTSTPSANGSPGLEKNY